MCSQQPPSSCTPLGTCAVGGASGTKAVAMGRWRPRSQRENGVARGRNAAHRMSLELKAWTEGGADETRGRPNSDVRCGSRAEIVILRLELLHFLKKLDGE